MNRGKDLSDISGWLFMALPGSIYAFGANKAWIAVGFLIGSVLNWYVVAPKHRNKKEELQITSKAVKVIYRLMVAVFLGVYMTAGLVAGGRLLERSTGLSYNQAITISIIVVLFIAFISERTNLRVLDVLLALLIIVMIIAIPLLAVLFMGKGNVIPNLIDSGLGCAADEFLNILKADGAPIRLIDIVSQLFWGISFCGMPHILDRIVAIKGDKEFLRSQRISVVWMLLVMIAVCLAGVIGRAYLYPKVLSKEESEFVLIEIIKKLFFENNMSIFGILLLCALLFAVFTSCGYQLRTSGAVIPVSLAAYLFAFGYEYGTMELFAMAWAGLGASFASTAIMFIVLKNMDQVAVGAGMLSGGISVILWNMLLWKNYPELISYSLLVGFFISTIVIVVVAFIGRRHNKEISNVHTKA